ncbi:MAG: dependent oxidoreductase [Homoserinimonas sp.]|nr:dependent oxidoreductase [Homoserinimonas sp.]
MANFSTDVIIVGAGHNALVCAAYLAEAGVQVLVLEGRDIIGGNTVTEELTLPGWHHDSCSSAHVVIQSNPLIKNDELGLLSKYGLKYVKTDPAVAMATEKHGLVVIPPDVEGAAAEFARFSEHDADALRQMAKDWDDGLGLVHAHFSAGLPLPDGPWAERYEKLRLQSAWEVVHATFQHPAIRQTMLWVSFATIQPPERPGTGALPAAIMMGRLRFGWATPVGGSGALPAALAQHIRDHGGQVLTNAKVASMIVEDGQCVGVRTSDGRTFAARRAVVASSHLVELPSMLESTPTPLLDAAASAWRPGLALFAVHLALKAEISYRTPAGALSAVAGGLGTPEGLRRQVAKAYVGETESDDPWILVVSSTIVDPARAPGSVLKFLTIAPSTLNGAAWTDQDAQLYSTQLLNLVRKHVDGLDDDSILFLRAESPRSLAAHNLSNIGGSCHGGEFALPGGEVISGWLDYRTEVAGLYLTGSTSHPGGSVSGRPGRNTARVLLEDLGIAPSTVMASP